MIEGFEDYTHDLTEYEEGLLPQMVNGLREKVGPKKSITNKQMEEALKVEGWKVNPARIRKIIHVIRLRGLLPRLVASSKGYYLATDFRDLDRYVRSLEQRETAIRVIRQKAKQELTSWVTPGQRDLFK